MKRFALISMIVFLYVCSVVGQNDWSMVNGGPLRTSWIKENKTLKPPFEIVEEIGLVACYVL